MPQTLLTADLHLAADQPHLTERWLQFLTTHAQHSDALYILGDLFEVWVGDDENEPFYQDVIDTLRDLTTRGIPVWVMRGNRDFLLNTGFIQRTGCQLLPDSVVVNLYGTPTLLMHGDTLCTKDTAYQTFRRQVRNAQWQQQFLMQPLAQRRVLAQQARLQSKEHLEKVAVELLDVVTEAVETVLKTHQVYHLIHGHTHRPAIHSLTIDGQSAYRLVVGAWDQEGALAVRCTPDGCQLINVPA